MWQAEDDEKLPCGHDRREALDPDNDPDLPGGYTVRRIACHACRAIHQERGSLIDPGSASWLFFIPTLEGGD